MADTENISPAGPTFGERVRLLRKQRGFSQGDLAAKIGYKGSNAISKIENNRLAPTTDVLSKIALALTADIHWLVTGNLSPTFDIFLDEYCEATARALPYIADEFSRLVERRGARKDEEATLSKSQRPGDTDCLVKLERARADIKQLAAWIVATTKDLIWFQRDAADILKSKHPLSEPDQAALDADSVGNGKE